MYPSPICVCTLLVRQVKVWCAPRACTDILTVDSLPAPHRDIPTGGWVPNIAATGYLKNIRNFQTQISFIYILEYASDILHSCRHSYF